MCFAPNFVQNYYKVKLIFIHVPFPGPVHSSQQACQPHRYPCTDRRIWAIMATGLKISYDFKQMLPFTDSISIEYHHFKEVFGEDGSVMFIGIKSDNLFSLDEFNDWWDLTYSIKAMEGVGEVVSLARIYQLGER